MLAPDVRTVAVEFLRPPTGYQLDTAVITTYTLDLEALLALPLGVLAHADSDLETLLEDPLLLLEAMREASGRLHVFVDESGIAVPRTHRELYGLLEEGVHPVRAPRGGVFHPKVWVARFTSEGEPHPLLRTGVMSRNLTYDRSWDVALVSEAKPADTQRRASGQLRKLIQRLPELATQTLSHDVQTTLVDLGDDAGRTRFPAPDGFEDPITYHAIGLDGRRWQPTNTGSRVLAVAPFVSRSVLEDLAEMGTKERLLVSRPEELDRIPEETLALWRMNAESEVLTLRDADLEEAEDGGNPRLSGLHAKIIAVERGWIVDWYVGSANLTHAAFSGNNVEVMAAITGPRSRPSSETGNGIEQFLKVGFRDLCTAYERVEDRKVENCELKAARQRIDEAQTALLAAPLTLVCSHKDDGVSCVLQGEVDVPAEVDAVTWPVSIAEGRCLPVNAAEWLLPSSRVTAFLAFRLHVSHGDVDDVRLTRKLSVEGMPEGRLNEMLRTLVDNPQRFLQLLRALLGGLEGMVDWALGSGTEDGSSWGAGFQADTLLEDLMRAASREPERMEPIRRLIEELTDSGEGQNVVPDEFLEVWNAVDGALTKTER